MKRILEVSRALNQLAQERKMPVIVCSQLTKKLKRCSDKHLIMQNLSQTCDIEQDLDGVIFVYCDFYCSNDDDDELILVKNRNDKGGTSHAIFAELTSES